MKGEKSHDTFTVSLRRRQVRHRVPLAIKLRLVYQFFFLASKKFLKLEK